MRFLGIYRFSDRKLESSFCAGSGPGAIRIVTVLGALLCGVSLLAVTDAARADSYDSSGADQYNLGSGDSSAGTPVNYADDGGSSVSGTATDGSGNQVVTYSPTDSGDGTDSSGVDTSQTSGKQSSNVTASAGDSSGTSTSAASVSAADSSSDTGNTVGQQGTTADVVDSRATATVPVVDPILNYDLAAGTEVTETTDLSSQAYFVKKGEGKLTVYSNIDLITKGPVDVPFPKDPNEAPPYGSASIEGGTLVVDGSHKQATSSSSTGNSIAVNSYVVVGRSMGSNATVNIINGAGVLAGSPQQATSQVPSSVTIALGAGSSGNVNISGKGSTLATYGQNGIITIGNGDPGYGQGAAHGTLTVTDGANVASDRIVLGNYEGASGVLNVGCPTCVTAASTQQAWVNAGGDTGVDPSKPKFTQYSGLYVNGAGNGTVNIYQNGVISVQGPLRFGSDTQSANDNKGHGEVNINNGGTLLVGDSTRSDNQATVPGIISYEKDYAFNINNGGTLKIFNKGGSLSTSIDMNLAGIATVDTNGGTASFSGNVKGSGALYKAGGGMLTLTSSNDYTGYTIVNQGDLRLAGNGLISHSGGILLGSTSVTQTDSSGNSTTSVDKGRLIIYKSGVTVLDQNIVHYGFAANDSDGGILQQGPGVTILTGQNSYHGVTEVAGGTLRIDGNQGGIADNNYKDAATGKTTVENGATLAGRGTIGGDVALVAGSTLAPSAADPLGGSSTGTSSVLNIKGDLTTDRTSSLVLVTNSGERQLAVVGDSIEDKPGRNYLNSDSVTVKGQATLNEGTVVEVKKGDQIRYDREYRLLTAEQGIKTLGGVETLKSKLPSYYFLTPSLRLVGRDYQTASWPIGLDFRLDRNDKKFESVSWTHNQHEVGRVLDHLTSDSDIAQAVAQVTTADEARAAQKSLAGELHASLRTALIQDSYYLREAVVNRVAQAMCDDNTAGSNIHTADLRTHRRDDGRCIKGRPVLWGQVYGGYGHISGNSNASAMHHSTAGFIMGADASLKGNDDWRVGAVVSYGRSMFNLIGENSSGNSNNVSVGAYSGGKIGDFRLTTGADYSWNMITTNRRFTIAGYGDSLHAHYNGGTAQVYADLAYPMHVGRVTQLEPFLNTSYVNLHTNRFRETGNYGMLKGRAKDDSVFYTTLGVRASTKVMVENVIIAPHVMVAYRHAVGNLRGKMRSEFTDGGGDMDIHGLALSEDEIVMDLGMRVNVTKDINVDVSYIGQYGGRTTASGAKADLKARF
ncbi:autotransporter domain-containing protein [Acetobacteraceae bacterium ESL0709]|nr:autotransporter domain-containing protein [Acetobacteraceae bacterium ESL0697]MDF7677219.1 autotransporter domain-containing protein [Acetobacteraceae bacterium ESL0709]